MKRILLLFVISVLAFNAWATSIVVSTQGTALVYQVNDRQELRQLYWGESLSDPSLYASMQMTKDEIYPTFGGRAYNQAAIRMTHADGNTSTELLYDSHTQEMLTPDVQYTRIVLRDPLYPVEVSLCYKAYQQSDMLEQWMEISHSEKKAIRLEAFASSYLSLAAQQYYLTEFHGDWADEMHVVETPLSYGIKTIDSKIGARATQYAHACYLLSLDKEAQENSGTVVGGQLAWGGSWRMDFEVDHHNRLHLLAGINDYASDYTLAPKTNFTTPAMLTTISQDGTGTVTRRFHTWARKYGIHQPERTRLTLLNNWEATYFDFNQQVLTSIIHDAADMGFELFLLDDGWFGNKHPRNNDDAGLGDWETNHTKLPEGIGQLVREATAQGIRFGIWLEPEMVNARSELYENHPDWIIHQPGRELDDTRNRNQLILDLSNPKVQDFVFGVVDRTMTENPGIAYIKWDCNRFMTNAGSYYLPKDKQSHIFIEYARGLYKVLDRVREKYPDTYIMLCSGGGGRIDYGTLKYFDEFWLSDNTDALDRIYMQWGATYFFPAMALASHVSVTPNHQTQRTTPLKFRFDVAMSAKLGMDLQPRDMSEEDKAFAKEAIQQYYKIRPVVQFGDLYRLISPYNSPRAAMMYVSQDQDEAVVFSYLLKKQIHSDQQVLFLQGLDPDKQYTITEINRHPKNWSWFGERYEDKTYSGEFLMKYGVRFPMYNEYESYVFHLQAK